jgi:hypothetical protein
MTINALPSRPIPVAPKAKKPADAAFEALAPQQKADLAVVRASELAPHVFGELWRRKGEVLSGFVAPYLHPIESWKRANAAVADAGQDGPFEAALAVLKHHGGILGAWLVPVSLGLSPFLGLASALAAAGTALGVVTVGAMAVSLVKNVVDASQAKTRADLDRQSAQILEDGIGLGTAAITAGVAHLGQKGVAFVRGRYGPGKPVPAKPLAPREMAPEAARAVRAERTAVYSDAEIAALKLEPAKAEALRGNSVKALAKDPATGRKFLFKPMEEGSTAFETERFAMTMRRAANEPTVPAVRQQLKTPDGKVLDGYVKPFVENEGLLKADPKAWTRGEQEAVLGDHAWAEFLGNYDTKSDQYVKMPGSALNVDWDHALSDYASPQALTRFKAHNPAPPAQAVLYQAYVRGEVDLDFGALRDAAARIAKIPDAQVKAELQPFLAKTFANGGTWGPYQTAEALTNAVLARKHNLVGKFEAFVVGLQQERAFNLGRGGKPKPWPAYVQTAIEDKKIEAIGPLVDTPAFAKGNQLIQALNAARTAR